jgi:hypothetical protein
MDSKIGSYGTVWGDKNTKIDDRNFFFQYKQLFEITFYVCMEAFIDPLASIQLFYCILRDEDRSEYILKELEDGRRASRGVFSNPLGGTT